MVGALQGARIPHLHLSAPPPHIHPAFTTSSLAGRRYVVSGQNSFFLCQLGGRAFIAGCEDSFGFVQGMSVHHLRADEGGDQSRREWGVKMSLPSVMVETIPCARTPRAHHSPPPPPPHILPLSHMLAPRTSIRHVTTKSRGQTDSCRHALDCEWAVRGSKWYRCGSVSRRYCGTHVAIGVGGRVIEVNQTRGGCTLLLRIQTV